MARLGFNVVRLGVLWAGVEPGTGGPNQPQICNAGPFVDPKIWNQQAANSYLNQVAAVVKALGQRHIYSILDMHQDVWSQLFGGEGMPDWATCTDGNPITIYPGRWSNNYSNPAVTSSFRHLFENDVAGNLQGEYQRSWSAIASRFATNPWVVGYDPMNEPADYSPVTIEDQPYSPGLSCLYVGSSGAAKTFGGESPLPCPAGSPKRGVIQAIEEADKTHLVFPEVDNATSHGQQIMLGSLLVPRIVFNFHDYCPQRSGVTGNPTDLATCSTAELTTMVQRQVQRQKMASASHPEGPGIFMTEFGATNSFPLASMLATDTTTLGLNWTWWSWRYYDDPTGSSAEALLTDSNLYSPAKSALSMTYAVAIAGSPVSSVLNPSNGMYSLTYLPTTAIKAPTSIFIPESAYPQGYCVSVLGGVITSKKGSAYLTVTSNSSASVVVVRIAPRKCINNEAPFPGVS